MIGGNLRLALAREWQALENGRQSPLGRVSQEWCAPRNHLLGTVSACLRLEGAARQDGAQGF
jgi:hypothetical protein